MRTISFWDKAFKKREPIHLSLYFNGGLSKLPLQHEPFFITALIGRVYSSKRKFKSAHQSFWGTIKIQVACWMMLWCIQTLDGGSSERLKAQVGLCQPGCDQLLMGRFPAWLWPRWCVCIPQTLEHIVRKKNKKFMSLNPIYSQCSTIKLCDDLINQSAASKNTKRLTSEIKISPEICSFRAGIWQLCCSTKSQLIEKKKFPSERSCKDHM